MPTEAFPGQGPFLPPNKEAPGKKTVSEKQQTFQKAVVATRRLQTRQVPSNTDRVCCAGRTGSRGLCGAGCRAVLLGGGGGPTEALARKEWVGRR